MDPWLVLIATIFTCITAIVFLHHSRRKGNFPPGPPGFPIIGNLTVLAKTLSDRALYLQGLMVRHGPLVSLKFGWCQFVFIGSHSLAHRSLVQSGDAYADRPDITPMVRVVNMKLKYISLSSHGPTWRLLRRNITREMIRPSQNMAYSNSRRWILSILISRLSESSSSVKLIDHLEYTILSLFVLMCFGQRLKETQIKEIGDIVGGIQHDLVTISRMYIFPYLGRILFRKELKKMIQVHDHANRVFIPLIRGRIHAKKIGNLEKDNQMLAYVDTLVDLHLPEEDRKLEEEEMVTLCGEFLFGGNDTTKTTIEWIMSYLVKHPECQNKLYNEIQGVVGKAPHIQGGEVGVKEVVEERNLEKMPYLKAVVLEVLRLRPPSNTLVPHKTKEDVELDGYTIPRNTVVNFPIGSMGRDPKVWENPMEFKPERFLAGHGEEFDITGNREIKMIPFGAGRRICPGLWLGMFHMQYVVANLIWYFVWSPIEGQQVDLTEKVDVTVVMKNPLQARVSQRI